MPILNSLSILGGYITPTQSGGLPWYADSSDAHHTVTLNGTVTQSDEGGGVKTASFADGGYLSVADVFNNISTGDFTVELFAEFNSVLTHTVTFVAVPGYGKFAFIQDSSNIVMGRIAVAADIAYSQSTDTNWHHLAVVRSGSTTTMYVDGVNVGSTQSLDGYDYSSMGETTIGNLLGNENTGGVPYNLDGKIAALRVTNTTVYTNSFTVPTTLPTNISGTQLLLNFGATAVPTV